MSEAIRIPLSRGLFTVVDGEDYADHIKGCGVNGGDAKWYAAGRTCGFYAARGVRIECGGRKEIVYLHRLIVGAAPGLEVDHINGDALDNRRSNLRVCTRAENARNLAKRPGGSSRFKGVSRAKADRVWRAFIRVDGRQISLVSFRVEREAARAYDDAAIREFGEFARTNFPVDAPARRSA